MPLLTHLRRLAGIAEERDHCLFCTAVAERNREVLAENASFVAVYDNFPVNEGHTLILPKRHIETVFELDDHEAADLVAILRVAKEHLDSAFHPDGFNVGINSGEAAGQTISHLHVHLIPRYRGDVRDPRGGIRNFKSALVPY